MNTAWITEEREILTRERTTLDAITGSLQHTTSEIDALVSTMRDNLNKREGAYSANDWDTYHALKAASFEQFEMLDWLIANL